MFPFKSPENIIKPVIVWCHGDQKGTMERKGSTDDNSLLLAIYNRKY